MVFSSPVFLFYFLPLVFLLYGTIARNIYLRNLLLFLVSLVFYFWGEKAYTLLVLFSVLINYLTGYLIENGVWRKAMLMAGLTINLGILIYFKYAGFILHECLQYFRAVPEGQALMLNTHLPLGISFFTFHGITYIVDIYRHEIKAASRFMDVGLYTLFFPQLIAGPIVRFVDIGQQINERRLEPSMIHEGIKRFITGLAKKVILANSLGYVAAQVYDLEVPDLNTSLVWFGILMFALQLYYDFSGYSDMAIGLALIFGFRFPENFNFPYAARSMSELWKRWHISLTSFFRNYLYIPLGGNQYGQFRTCLNLLLVFTLTGLWHGASWNCIFWGMYTGITIVLEKLFLAHWVKRWPYWLANMYTMFLFLISVLIFKVEEGKYLTQVLAKAFFLDPGCSGIYNVRYFMSPDLYVLIPISILLAYPLHQYISWKFLHGFAQNKVVQMIYYGGLFLCSVSMLAASTYNPFIYFKF